MPDPNLVYDGFTVLSGGMNAGLAPSLISKNQVAKAVNLTFRDGFIKTRPPFIKHPLTFSTGVQANFTGKFQGATAYTTTDGSSGFVLSVGGRLFRINSETGPSVVSDITPSAVTKTSNAFVVPAGGGTVTANVNDSSLLLNGETVYVDSGQYTVLSVSGNSVLLQYVSGAATQQAVTQAFTVPVAYATAATPATSFKNESGAGAPVSVETCPAIYYDTVGLQWYQWTGSAWVTTSTPQVTINVNQNITAAAMNVGATVHISGGAYTVISTTATQITLQYAGTAVNISVAGGTAITDNSSNPIYSLVGASVIEGETLSPGQAVKIDSGSYTIVSVLGNSVTLQYGGGAAHSTVATNTPVLTSGSAAIYIVVSGTPVLDSSHNPIIVIQTNQAAADYVDLFQAENYVIGLAEQHPTLIYDGASSRLAIPGSELPSGVFGIYLWGRIWIVLPGRRTFMAGDLVYSSSGTQTLGFVDAVLKTTENDFLNEGGSFGVPSNSGPITSLFALATQDTSLGIGNLLVGTSNSIISVNTPVDRTTWKNLTYPIQTLSLLDFGPAGNRGVGSVNGDAWFRTLADIRSFIVARRAQNQWGNTPQSREVAIVLDTDTESLLRFSSAMLFDNRLFFTANPYRTPYGVAHRGAVVVNFDLLSSMNGKADPAWEGVWDGLENFQFCKVRLNNEERGFMFVLQNGEVQLWEIAKTGYFDSYTVGSQVNTTAINSLLETRSCDFGDPSQLIRLETGELYLDDIVETVSFTVKFRSDQTQNWTTWTTFTVCADVIQCSPVSSCTPPLQTLPAFQSRIMLPNPPDGCNTLTGRPVNQGYEFQFRFEIAGHCRIRRFKLHALVQPDKTAGDCLPNETCLTQSVCDSGWFVYDSIS